MPRPPTAWATAITGAGARSASRAMAGAMQQREETADQHRTLRFPAQSEEPAADGCPRPSRRRSSPTPPGRLGTPAQSPVRASETEQRRCSRNVEAHTTITQSHVCDTSSCQPPLRSARKLWRSPCRRPRGSRSSASEVALTANVTASTTNTAPGFATAATTPAIAGPDDEGHAPGEAEQRVGLLEPLRTDRRGHEAGRRGLEERIRRPVDRKEHREVPDLRRAGEQEHRSDGLNCAADDVRDEHDHLPGKAVRPDPADEDKEDEWHASLPRARDRARSQSRRGS